MVEHGLPYDLCLRIRAFPFIEQEVDHIIDVLSDQLRSKSRQLQLQAGTQTRVGQGSLTIIIPQNNISTDSQIDGRRRLRNTFEGTSKIA